MTRRHSLLQHLCHRHSSRPILCKCPATVAVLTPTHGTPWVDLLLRAATGCPGLGVVAAGTRVVAAGL
eukprot:1155783-Lingulodinium_polyedra.AAC.1